MNTVSTLFSASFAKLNRNGSGSFNQSCLFGNQESNKAEQKSPVFSRSKDYFLVECQDSATTPFASFAAGYLNTALNLSFGTPHPYQALASDDETCIQLTLNPMRLLRLQEILGSVLFDPQGDRWSLSKQNAKTEFNDRFILSEKIINSQTGQPETRDILVMLLPTQD